VVPSGRLSGIVMQPITVELYRDDDLLAKITADKAFLRARDRSIVFQGQVRMASGEKWLTTRRLSLGPQTASVSVEAPYRRYHDGQVEEGRQLQTDLHLNPHNHPGGKDPTED
jgi:lipopolysaccharide export system protein LptC